jgi:hypothetical protein
MAGFQVAGPAEIHVGTGAGGGLAFLGYSEAGVRVSNRAHYEDVKSDVLGPMSPTEIQQMGAELWVSFDLRISNEAVWQSIASRANNRLQAVAEGFYPNGVIGALVGAEGLAYRLLVFKPYASKAIFTAAGVRPCFNSPFAYLAGPDDIDPIGVRAQKIRVVFRSILQRNPATGDCVLYNSDASGKPPPV